MFKSMIVLVLVLSVITFVIPFNVFADDVPVPVSIQYTTLEDELVQKDITIFILSIILFVVAVLGVEGVIDLNK